MAVRPGQATLQTAPHRPMSVCLSRVGPQF